MILRLIVLTQYQRVTDRRTDEQTRRLSRCAKIEIAVAVEFYYVGKIPCTYWYWGPVEAATRGFEPSKHLCRR